MQFSQSHLFDSDLTRLPKSMPLHFIFLGLCWNSQIMSCEFLPQMMPFACNDPLAVPLQLTINCKTYTSPESYNNHWLLCLRSWRCLGLGTGGFSFSGDHCTCNLPPCYPTGLWPSLVHWLAQPIMIFKYDLANQITVT